MDKDKKQKTALITGVTGQAGSYLSELFLEKDYRVVGLHRRSSTNTFERISHLINNEDLELVEWDITDPISVSGIINEYKPDYCVNTAGQTHVATSFEQPAYTSLVNYMGVQYLLDSIVKYSPHTKFLTFSTSEMFGNNYDEKDGIKYQDENTKFAPASPYAVSKVAAHYLVDNYRKSYGIHASCIIAFNYESNRRGEEFVTRKITKWIGKFQNWKSNILAIYNDNEILFQYGRIKGSPPMSTDEDICAIEIKGDKANQQKIVGKFPKLRLGNLDSKRDWGYARDVMMACYLMLQQDKPDDYVVATGHTYSIRDFLDVAFDEVGMTDWFTCVTIDPKFYRPSDVEYLLGDASKAKRELGWEPTVSFEELIHRMVQSDIEKERK